MIAEIISFYKIAPSLIKNNLDGETLGSYLDKSNFSKYLVEYHIIPMVAAIWSMPFSKARDMPLKLFLNFFINHGLFKLKNRPQWYTVTGRSRTYVKKVLAKISGEIFKNYKVNSVSRNENNVRIKIGDDYLDYDHVVLASHADQSLKMLDKPTEEEQRILSKFKYVSNEAILHSDENLMPKKKLAWSSWNSISNGNKTCVTYWLNNLQNLKSDKNFFLTLNPIKEINKKNIVKNINFTHPYFNSETLKYQKSLFSLQGKKRTWYCGSYFSYGFHEDGIKSAINLIENFKI
jgi:predicted NAD/FAD-binding protein